MRRNWLTVGLSTIATAAIVVIGVHSMPAFAGGGSAGGTCDPADQTCTIHVEKPGAPGSGGDKGGDGKSSTCAAGLSYQPVGTLNGLIEDPPPGYGWYGEYCGAQLVRIVLLSETNGAPTITAAELAQRASGILDLPMPSQRLQPNDPLVNSTTWLSLSGGWAPHSATASVPGLSATATATPRRAVWTMGDGSTVTCDGPGRPYDPGLPYDAQSPTCSHVYTHSSASAPAGFPARVSITFDVTWTASNGAGGQLAPLTTTTAFAVRVRQGQTVNEGPER